MPIQSVTIDVNTSTIGEQEQPDGILLDNGNILVVWFDPIGPDGTEAGSSIRGQLVSPDGVFVGSEFVVSGSSTNNLGSPQVSALADGGFTAAWEVFPRFGVQEAQILGQRYDASGTAVGSEFVIADTLTGTDAHYTLRDLVTLDNGNLVSVFQANQPANFPSQTTLFQIFDSQSNPVFAEPQPLLSSTNSFGNSYDFNVVALNNGGFTVSLVFDDFDHEYPPEAIVRFFDTDGMFVREHDYGSFASNHGFGNEDFITSQNTAIDVLSNGNVLVSYTSYSRTYRDELVPPGDIVSVETLVEGAYYNIYDTEGNEITQGPVTYHDDDVAGKIVALSDGFAVQVPGETTVTLYDNSGSVVETGVTLPDGFMDSVGSADNVFGLSINALIGTDANGAGIDLQIFSEFEGVEVGTSASETLNGDAGVNTLFGLDGDDVINGEAGDDRIDGGQGADTLNGGAGNDTLIGGLGVDNYDGGGGIDTLDYSDFGISINLRMDTGIALLGASQVSESFINVESFRLGSANDNFFGDGGDSRVDAGAGNDVLRGNGGADTLNGDAGNDIIYFDHLDIITGGDGYDRAYAIQGTQATQIDLGASGLEFVSGGSFVDILDAQTATQAVKLFGNFGDDVLTGSAFDDYINGGQSDDVISGGAGKDVLDGSLGADEFYGGDGDDIFYIDSDDTTIEGGEGYDRIYVRGYSDGVNLVVGSTTGIEFAAGNNLDDIFDGSLSTTAVKLLGGVGNDTLMGGSAADQLYGFTGDDTLSGGGGNDILNAAQGADILDGGAGDDIIYMDSDDISVIGGSGYDRVYANGYSSALTLDMTAAGVEFVYGSIAGDNFTAAGSLVSVKLVGGNGDDILTGGESHDQIFAQNGNDTLAGGAGNDLLSGGAGADTFVFSANWGDDLLADFENGIDIFDMSALGITFADLSVANNASGQAVISYGGDSITLIGIDETQVDAADFSF